MVQITFGIEAAATTTVLKRDATTSGPIRLPHWAPDIMFISTTTVHGQGSLITPTTTSGFAVFRTNANGGYNTRCFGLKQPNAKGVGMFIVGTIVTLNYVAVGEMVRT